MIINLIQKSRPETHHGGSPVGLRPANIPEQKPVRQLVVYFLISSSALGRFVPVLKLNGTLLPAGDTLT